MARRSPFPPPLTRSSVGALPMPEGPPHVRTASARPQRRLVPVARGGVSSLAPVADNPQDYEVMAKILFVHGMRMQDKPREPLLRSWYDALRASLAQTEWGKEHPEALPAKGDVDL